MKDKRENLATYYLIISQVLLIKRKRQFYKPDSVSQKDEISIIYLGL